MNSYIQASLEAIDHQDPKKLFFPLTTLLTQLCGCVDDKLRNTIVKEIESKVFKETGLSVSLEHVEKDIEISVSMPTVTINFPYAYRSQKAVHQALIGKKIDFQTSGIPLKGTIDLKSGKVSGDWSHLPSKVLVPLKDYHLIENAYTPEERAACILHELGHLVGFYECVSHESMHCLQMASVIHAWMKGDKEIRSQTIAKVTAENRIVFDDPVVLVEDDNLGRVLGVLTAMSVKKHRSELGLLHYDAIAFEKMADTFATRHGAGRALVTALDKGNRSFPRFFREAGYRPTSLSALSSLATFGGLIASGIVAAIPTGIVLGVSTISSFMVAGTFTIGDYERPDERYKTIRREIISGLKDGYLSKEKIDQITKDLEVIDSVMASLTKDLGFSNFGRFFMGLISGANKEIKIRKQYEELANNSLFLKSQQLKALV